jgi:hypothetical protein
MQMSAPRRFLHAVPQPGQCGIWPVIAARLLAIAARLLATSRLGSPPGKTTLAEQARCLPNVCPSSYVKISSSCYYAPKEHKLDPAQKAITWRLHVPPAGRRHTGGLGMPTKPRYWSSLVWAVMTEPEPTSCKSWNMLWNTS